MLDELKRIFYGAIEGAYPEVIDPGSFVEVTQSRRAEFGHYQCNSAMRLGKILGQPPRKIAEQLIETLVDSHHMVARLEVAGPGFINIHLDMHFLSQLLDQQLRSGNGGIVPALKRQKVIVEYSSPNTAKEMHVGHLRSTIIGESLARLMEALGHEVLRLNHVGDWGTNFGMLIAYMKAEQCQGEALEDLVNFYKAAKLRFDQDPVFKRASQEEVVRLQGGDPEALDAWKRICAISRQAYEEIYALLDVHLLERGESFYNPMLPQIVDELEQKGLITLSNGAKCVFLEGFTGREGDPQPQIVQKSDGGYNYSTTDLAALKQRVEEERAERIIYVVDLGQKVHFEMVFATAQLAEWVDPSKTELNHAGFGLVLGADGKKFRTRSGETEKLIDLLTRAVEHAGLVLKERIGEDIESAKRLGIGAVKYADLSVNRMSDYQFSYDKMLSLEGNTAAFLFYSYVRIKGIKRKVGLELNFTEQVVLEHPSEQALGLHLVQFSETLDLMARDLLPNRLTDYLYTLAELFNAFFRDCRVEGTPEQNRRLLLCEAAEQVMGKGFYLLGLQPLERM
ncbi:MAG: arginine--tRNA ligase [Verrucomicrobia bacterium]|nr:arginine--tRNA ligase [Verrucomicrobiota bacterium]